MLASFRRISGRRTIISIALFVRTHCAGITAEGFSRTVCSITRGPAAKPIRGFVGDVEIAQHRKTGGNAAHCRIGQYRNVETEPRSCIFARRRRGFRHLHPSDINASCIRARRRKQKKHTNGRLSSAPVQRRELETCASTDPIEPPMSANSNAAATADAYREASDFHDHQRVFSRRFFFLRGRQSVFIFWSRGTSVFYQLIPNSTREPSS